MARESTQKGMAVQQTRQTNEPGARYPFWCLFPRAYHSFSGRIMPKSLSLLSRISKCPGWSWQVWGYLAVDGRAVGAIKGITAAQ